MRAPLTFSRDRTSPRWRRTAGARVRSSAIATRFRNRRRPFLSSPPNAIGVFRRRARRTTSSRAPPRASTTGTTTRWTWTFRSRSTHPVAISSYPARTFVSLPSRNRRAPAKIPSREGIRFALTPTPTPRSSRSRVRSAQSRRISPETRSRRNVRRRNRFPPPKRRATRNAGAKGAEPEARASCASPCTPSPGGASPCASFCVRRRGRWLGPRTARAG